MASLRVYNGYIKNLQAQSSAFNTVSSGLKVQQYKDNPNARDHCEYEEKEGYSIKSFKDKDGYIFIQGAYF